MTAPHRYVTHDQKKCATFYMQVNFRSVRIFHITDMIPSSIYILLQSYKTVMDHAYRLRKNKIKEEILYGIVR